MTVTVKETTVVTVTETGTTVATVAQQGPEGASGGIVGWGLIGGDIQTQSDLQASLAQKYNASNPANYINDAGADARITLQKATANGLATLGGDSKIPMAQMPAAMLGASIYQGTWNASTNTPTLVTSTGSKGFYYVVSVAGATNLNGITDWKIGDWAIYNGTAWEKVDNTDAVLSVNGQTGAVTVTNITGNAATVTTINGRLVAGHGLAISGAGTSASPYAISAAVPILTLTDAANIAWNTATSPTAEVTIQGNRTLDLPTNIQNGGTYQLWVMQDNIGGRTLTGGAGVTIAGSISTAANSVGLISFSCRGGALYGVAVGW